MRIHSPEIHPLDELACWSAQMPRFINASVQTPNTLLRMVAEEICGQNSRKPADRSENTIILYTN